MSSKFATYMEVQNVPHVVTLREMEAALKSMVKCKIICVGFDPKVTAAGKKFYFIKPSNKSVQEVINAVKGKFVRGQKLRIYVCQDVTRIKSLWGHKEFQASKICRQIEAKPRMIARVCKALFDEIFDRYPQLDDINTETNNAFAYELVKELTKRLTDIEGDLPEAEEINKYRLKYRHSTDFELVESAYKRCGADTPLPSEPELEVENMPLDESLSLNLSEEKLEEVSNYYRNQIIELVKNHISLLDTNCPEDASEEERARVLARQNLKVSMPKIAEVVNRWMPKFIKFHQDLIVRVYGMPRLPAVEYVTMLVTSRGGGEGKKGSSSNHYAFYVNRDKAENVLAMSGKTLDGCTLLVRVQHKARVMRLGRSYHHASTELGSVSTVEDEEWQLVMRDVM